MWTVIKVLENHRLLPLPKLSEQEEDRSEHHKELKVCPAGCQDDSSTDCPTCGKAIPMPGDLPQLTAPARRALERMGIFSLQQLAQYQESEILALYGMGSEATRILRVALEERGMGFRE